VEVKDPTKFFKILDKQHADVIKSTNAPRGGGKDWDIFNPRKQTDSKSQMSRHLNLKTLEQLESKKPDSLSVMGH
jgi:hypothetical protein